MSRLELVCRPIGQNEYRMAVHLLTEAQQKKLRTKGCSGIVALAGEIPAGVLLYHVNGATIQVEHIFVTYGYRRSGVGTTLMNAMFALADHKKMNLVASFSSAGRADGISRFFSSFRRLSLRKEEGFDAWLSKEDVEALCQKFQKPAHRSQYFFEQSKSAQQKLIQQIKHAFPVVAWELEFDHSSYRADLCCCKVENGEIQAVCLLKEVQGELELSLLYTKQQKGALGAKVLLDSIGSLAEAEICPIWVSPIGGVSAKLLDQICPGYEIKKWFYTAYDLGKAYER